MQHVKQKGTVLVMTLLWLSLILIIVVEALQSAGLEQQMTRYYLQRQQAFVIAENNLNLVPKALLQSAMPLIQGIGFEAKLLTQEGPWLIYYQVMASGQFQRARAKIFAEMRVDLKRKKVDLLYWKIHEK